MVWVLIATIHGGVPSAVTHVTVTLHSDSAACEAARQQNIRETGMLMAEGECLSHLTPSCEAILAAYASAINSTCLPVPYEKAIALSQQARDGSLVRAFNAARDAKKPNEKED